MSWVDFVCLFTWVDFVLGRFCTGRFCAGRFCVWVAFVPGRLWAVILKFTWNCTQLDLVNEASWQTF